MTKQSNVFKDAYNRCVGMLPNVETLPSEPELGRALGVSRTTVRAILKRMRDQGLIAWEKRRKTVLRAPAESDYFPDEETDPLSTVIERTFMRRILAGDARPGAQFSELELAREIGVGTTSVREFLIRFSRFGLIEKRPNSLWILKGFTRDFALELTEIREMFELKSAAAFVRLPRDHPAWRQLDAIRADHHEMLADFEARARNFSELDKRFHLLVHQASHNRFIVDFHDVISMIFHYHYQWNKVGARERSARALEEHLAYIAALCSGDPDKVETACRAHLKTARETLLQSLPSGA